MLKVSDLKKSFGGREVIKGVSFNLNKGEIVGLLGPNGAGKTTIMRMIAGLLAPDSGFATINDKSALLDVAARSLVGFMPENNPLYYDLTGYEYWRFSGEAYGVKFAELDEKIEEMAEKLGVSDMLFKKIGEMSKGYKQRTGIGACLLHSPELVVLDEPTEGLDPNQRISMRSIIKDLAKDAGVLISSHVLPELENVVDRVIVLSEGKIVADDTLDNLKRTVVSGRDVVRVVILGDFDESSLSADFILNKNLSASGEVSELTVDIVPGNENRWKLLKMIYESGGKIVEFSGTAGSFEDVFRILTEKSDVKSQSN